MLLGASLLWFQSGFPPSSLEQPYSLFNSETPIAPPFPEARIEPSMMQDAAPEGETADYSWKQAEGLGVGFNPRGMQRKLFPAVAK